MELLRNSRILWSVVCEEGDRVVNCPNRVDCEAMCGLMSCDMKCMNALCVNPSTPVVLTVELYLLLFMC